MCALCLSLVVTGCNLAPTLRRQIRRAQRAGEPDCHVVSDTQINLSWMASTDNVGVTGYLVERCTAWPARFAQISTPAGITSATLA